jgi:O-methyltransferase involved in polyketide biosynthesis
MELSVVEAKTATWVAAERHRETLREDRIINGTYNVYVCEKLLDQYAELLLGKQGAAIMTALKQRLNAKALNRSLALRARWTEDLIKSCVNRNIAQIVNAG